MPEVLDKKAIKALSVDTRLDIVKILARRPHTASELAKAMNKHVTTVTEHLNVLESADLIARKESTNKWVYYELTKKGEHLFKPNIYSWTVVFLVSLVAVVGGWRFIFSESLAARESAMQSGAPADAIAQTAAAAQINILATVVAMAGILGIVYSVNRLRKIYSAPQA